MTIAESIHEQVRVLPPPLQLEVLDFVEYLRSKVERDAEREDDDSMWSAFSLASAMRGMEDESGPEYSLEDIKDTFT